MVALIFLGTKLRKIFPKGKSLTEIVRNKFGNKNNFNQKVDELNQETENLIDEIEKWQT